MSRSELTSFLTTFLLAGAASLPAADAAERPVPLLSNDRVSLEVGAFFPALSTTVRVDALDGRAGTSVDFEQNLRFDDRKMLASLQLTAFLSTRWRLQAEYLDLSRSSSTRLTRDLVWGDNLYEVGADVRGHFDIRIARLSAGYTMIARKDWELGGVFGVHVTDVSTGIGVRVTGGGDSLERELSVDTGGLVPLPNLGAYWAWAFADDWILDARADFLVLEIAGVRGRLLDGALNIRRSFGDTFSLGIGYSAFDITVEMDEARWNGSFEFGYNGPRIFGVLRF